MKTFNNVLNYTDVYFRDLAICVSKFLNDKLYIEQVISENNIEKTLINFSYGTNISDERYFQDNFLQHTMNDLVENKIAEGNYDILPRGSFVFTQGNILLSELTNRFVLGTKMSRENNKLKKGKSKLNRLPIEVSCRLVIKSDTLLNQMKIVEQFVKTFYKSNKTTFIHRDQEIDVYVVIPENLENPEVSTFSFGQMESQKFEIELQLAIKSYMYVFDTIVLKRTSRMKEIHTTFEFPDGDTELLITDETDIPK